MPYAPGVTDIRGQLIAQGVSQFGGEMANGIRQYQKNKTDRSYAEGFAMGRLRSNPVLQQAVAQDPDTQKLADKITSGQGTKDDAMKFAGWVVSAEEGQRQAQAYQAAQQEAQVRQLQIAAAQQQAEQAARAAQLRQLYQNLGNGVGSGVYSSQVQRQANTPAGQFAQQTVSATGQLPTPEGVERFLTSRQGPNGNEIDSVNLPGTDAQGRPTETAVDRRTGRPIMIDGKPASRPVVPVGVLLPEDQAKATELTKLAEHATQDNSEIIKGGRESAKALAGIQRAQALLATTNTGSGTDIKAAAQNVAKTLGIDMGNPSNVQELNSIFGNHVVDMARGLGRITNFELQAFSKFSAATDKTPEANAAILSALARGHEREVQVAEMVTQMRAQGISERIINQKANEFLLTHPIFDEKRMPGSTATPTADALLQKYGIK